MTANDSSTGGYLFPTTEAPVEDQALVVFMQGVVKQITGIPGTLVRPKWQPEPPPELPATVDWIALGVANQEPDAFPYFAHIGTGEGSDQMQRHESFDLECTTIGPNCQGTMAMLCDGLAVAQNREAMETVGIKLVRCGQRVLAPELIKERWYRRVDCTIKFRRELDRTYPVLSLLESVGVVLTDTASFTFDASPF